MSLNTILIHFLSHLWSSLLSSAPLCSALLSSTSFLSSHLFSLLHCPLLFSSLLSYSFSPPLFFCDPLLSFCFPSSHLILSLLISSHRLTSFFFFWLSFFSIYIHILPYLLKANGTPSFSSHINWQISDFLKTFLNW